MYAREGEDGAWLADPLARLLEILRLEDGRRLETWRGDAVVLAEPFESHELELDAHWAT